MVSKTGKRRVQLAKGAAASLLSSASKLQSDLLSINDSVLSKK